MVSGLDGRVCEGVLTRVDEGDPTVGSESKMDPGSGCATCWSSSSLVMAR